MQKIIDAIFPAISGSIITLTFGYLAYLYKKWKEKSKSCIIIAIHLEKFVYKFITIYYDNSEYISTQGSEGHMSIAIPEFKTSNLQINWSPLSKKLTNDIFTIESKISVAKRMMERIDSTNLCDFDYEDIYIEHVTPIADLSLELSNRLRAYGGIPMLDDYCELKESLQHIKQRYMKIIQKNQDTMATHDLKITHTKNH